MENTKNSLTQLIGDAKSQLELLNYANGTQKQYALKWKHFSEYAEKKGENYFSQELGCAFLKNYYGINTDKKLSSSQAFKVRTITILGELQEQNCFFKCHQKKGKQPPVQFHDILKIYGKLQLKNKISKQTIDSKNIILTRFLNFLDKQGVSDIKELTAHEVLAYLQTLGRYSSNSRSGILFTLRKFLFFLHSEGVVKEPLNDLFPVIFSYKYERLPSYYSTDEVHAILCQVDRKTEFGKRDYLILLLAVQFGMRAGDIRQLKFKEIKWSRKTIEIIQKKTNKPLQLPITEEFKYALADYIKDSRPKVDDPHIFIRHRAPFQPFANQNTFYHVINKHMILAGIQLNGRKHGLHSMRHSTASHLLQNNTPYPVITAILGHENTSTTKLYLRIDIQQLRTVALEIPNEKY
jgi:site-specific recombinase XerD